MRMQGPLIICLRCSRERRLGGGQVVMTCLCGTTLNEQRDRHPFLYSYLFCSVMLLRARLDYLTKPSDISHLTKSGRTKQQEIGMFIKNNI